MSGLIEFAAISVVALVLASPFAAWFAVLWAAMRPDKQIAQFQAPLILMIFGASGVLWMLTLKIIFAIAMHP